MRQQQKRYTRPVVEELEPRILHSADAAVLYPPAALVQLAEVRLVDAGYTAVHSAADATPAAAAVVSAHREIAIVDSAVPDYQDLVDDIRATSRGAVDVYILDGTSNGLDQVSRILASQHDIRAIHIISHGSEGAIQLGSGLFDLHALQRNAAAIAGWGAALSEDADILVYGCDVAAGPSGQAFVDALSRITGADVAASEDLTGAQSRGGNWNFEYHRGSIEAQSAFSAAAEAAWAGTLANTAPVLIGANNLATIDEDASGNPGSLVSDIIAGMVTDIDAGDPQGIAVTGVVNINGAWEFSLNSGGSWTAFGSPSQASAQLLAADATTFVRFVPNANWNDTVANGLTFRAWDQSDLAASGTTADVSVNGGATAFSSTEASASITVTPVNDAPTLGNGTLAAVNEDTASPAGQTVSTTFTGQFADVDAGSSFSGIAVVGNTASALTQGVWQYSSNAGGNWFAVGTVSEGATALAINASSLIRFVPVANYNGTPTALTVRGLDDTYAGGFSTTAGAQTRVNVDTTTNGGSTAIAAATAALSTSITPVNDAPTATNLNAAQTYTEDTPLALTPIVVSDIDSTDVTVTLTLSNTTAGSLNTGTSGAVTSTYVAGTGVWTASGAIADVNTLLGGLVFTPTLDFNSNFAIATSVSDGVAAAVTGSKAMTGTAVNDAPVITTMPSSKAFPIGAAASAVDAALTVSDVDNASLASATVSITGGYVSGKDVLAFTTQPGITGTWSAASGVLSLSGNATVANYELALRSVTFATSSTTSGPRVVSFQASDGITPSTTATRTITVGQEVPALWVSAKTNASTSAGTGGLTYSDGQIARISGPNLALGAGVSNGTFSRAFDIDSFAQDGNADIIGLHYVSTTVTVGSTNAATLQRGDILLCTTGSETLGGVAVTQRDIVLFRPTTAGDYSAGTFSILLRQPGDTGANIREFALVETPMTVGGTALQAGDFLLVLGGGSYDKDVQRFQATTMGTNPTGGTLSILIDGDGSAGMGISQQIHGLELVQHDITLGGANLTQGQLLVSLSGDALVGTNALAVTSFDIFVMTVGATGNGTSSGTAAMLLRGADVGLSSGGEEHDALALVGVYNTAPVLDTTKTPVLAAQNEDVGAPVGAVGTLVSELIDFNLPAGQLDNVTDPDTDAQPGIAVIAADTTSGSWWYSTNNGGAWSALGVVSGNSARLLAADSGTRVYFQPTANYSGTLTDAIVFRAWDHTVGSNGGTADTTANGGATPFSAAFDGANLTITGINDAPVRTAGTPAAIAVNEDASNTTAVTLGLGGLAYGPGGGADESAQTLTYKVTAFPAFITLWLADGTTSVAADTVVSMAQLQGLKYKTVADASGSGNLTWTVQDSGGTANSGADTLTENLAITVAAVNDAPVLSGAENLGGINQNEMSSGGTLVSDLLLGHVTDVDATAANGIAVTGVNNTNGAWQYSINSGGAWTAFGSPGAATARLLAADASTYVRFVPNANWVGTVAGGLTFRAWDQTSGLAGGTGDVSSSGGTTAFSTASASASITVHAYPIVFPGTYLEDFSSLGASGTQMAAGYRSMMIAGSGATYDASNPITAAAIASATAANQTLLVWNPGDSPVHSQTQLANAGSIGNASDRALLSGSNNNGATVIELAMRNTTGSPLATISFAYNMKVLADSGGTPATEAGALPGYSFFYSLTGGTTAAEWVAVPSLATASTVVGTVTSVSETISFATPLAHNSTIYFRWADDNFPSVDQDFAIDNVAVQRVNNAPALAGIEGAAAVYVENAAATPVSSTLTVADADNVNLTGATVTISANYANGQDVLNFANQNGITGSWSAATGVLSLSGTTSLANYQTALRSVAYSNSSDAPSTLTRTVSFAVSDGADASNTVTRDITVTAVNDAPLLTGANDLSSINRNPSSNTGTLVADLLAGHITDPDAAAVSGIAVTSVANTNGSWQYSTDGGSIWTAFGAPDATTARLLAADIATFVRFVPDADWSGTVTNGLSFRAWDQSSGGAGGTANVGSSGGATAFSATTVSASLIVTTANTAPVLSGANDLSAINEDPAANSGTLVSALIAGRTSDADPGAVSGIAVTAVDNTNGAWQYSLNGGSTWANFASPSESSARLLAANASSYVRFAPNADWNGSVAAGITFRAWDQSSGSAGSTADTRATSGNFLDYFASALYSNNNGTLSWTGPWVENDSQGGGASGGRFAISSGVLQVQVAAAGDHIYREADLSGSLGATLSFNYRNGLGASARIDVQVSGDGGATYTTVAGGTFNASNSGKSGSASFDISSAIAANTRVRFYVVSGETGAGNNGFTLDNVQIVTSGGSGGSTAFSTATASASVTVNAVNDAPVRTAGTVSDLTVLEDAGATSLGLGGLNYGAGGGTDETGQTFTYRVTALPSAALGVITLADETTAVVANTNYSLGQMQGMKFKSAANAGGGPSAFSWTVIDSGGTANGGVDTRSESLNVSVTSVNDTPLGTSTTVTALEDTAYIFTAADFGFTDPSDSPANALLAVKMTTVPGAGTLALSGMAVSAGQFVSVASIDAGNLTFTAESNANGAGYTSFTFQVQDDGGVANGGADLDPTPKTMTVNVTPVNDAPLGASTTVSTLEDTAYTFTASDFGFSDTADTPANALLNVRVTTVPGAGALSLSGMTVSAGQSVSVANINAGNLTFIPGVNAHGAGYASFTFQVRDDGGVANGGADLDPTPKTMTVNVTPVNDAPLGASTTVTTLEDTAYIFTAADFGFSDTADTPANALLSVRMTTVPGAGALSLSGVAVSAGQSVTVANINAGNLTFIPGVNANGAAYASFTFQVRDDGGVANGGADLDAAPKTMTVNVTPVNDAPLGASTTVTTLEDAAYIFSVADFGFTDPTDAASAAGAHAPTAVRITALPGAGALTLSGTAVSAGQFVSAADIAAGALAFAPGANANGAGYASFTFQVRDDGGVANGGADLDPTPKTMTVNVTPVNDAPLGASTTVTTLEDTAYIFTAADFGFSDTADTPANALLSVRMTTVPGAGALSLSGVAVSAGQSVTVANINAGNLTFIPGVNANGAGYASFTFQVQDDGGVANGGADLDAAPKTMTVNVTPVNDAPLGTSTTVTTLEDAAYIFSVADFGFTDPTDAASAAGAHAPAAVRITALPGAGALTLSGIAVSAGQFVSAADIAAGALAFAPGANANGAGYASFTFQVRDDGGVANGGADLDPTPKTMTVNVTPVNDAPAGAARTVTTLEDAAYTFNAADFGFTDATDAASAAGADALAAIRIAALPLAGVLAHDFVPVTSGQLISIADINAGRLMFIPATNANGAAYASFTFHVQDDGGVANGGVDLDPVAHAMTLDVTPVNDAPAGADKTIATLEDTPYSFKTADFGFADAADAPPHVLLNARIVTLPGAGGLTLDGVAVAAGELVSATDIAAGRLVFSPAPDAHGAGYASFTFRVQDDGGVAHGGVDIDAIARTISVDVTSVNDAPGGADATVVTLEDSSYTFRVADFGFADRDSSAFLAVRIGSVQGAGTLTLGGAAVTDGQLISAASIAAGELMLIPAANANGAAHGSFTFQVQDDGGIANGGADLDPVARAMRVDVTSVNDAPAGVSRTVTTREDIAYTFGVADFGYSDPADAMANALLNIRVVTVPMAGSLTLSGVAVKAGDVIAAARVAAGELAFTPATRGTGAGYASFTFRVQDDGGVANGGADTDATPRAITVDVIRTKFPEPAPALGPVIFSDATQPEEAVVSSAETTSDARSRSAVARAAAALKVAPTRIAPAGDGDIPVSVLDRPAARAADDGVRSARSSASARSGADATGPVAPVLVLEPVAEVNVRPLIIQTFGPGSRAAGAPAASEGSDTSEENAQLRGVVTLENGVRASAILLSAGVVTWTLQGAGLIGSLLTSAPAWRQLDPMPVLAPEEEKPDWGDDDGDSQREEDAADSLWRSDGPRPARPA